MVGVGLWGLVNDKVIPFDAVLRQTFGWTALEVVFIAFVFVVMIAPVWVRSIRHLSHARADVSAQESLFTNIFHGSPGICAISDPTTGRIFEVNERLLSALGHQRDEVIGKTSLELHIWPTAKIRRRLIEEMDTAGGHLRDYEIQICAKSGKVIDVLMSGEKIIYKGEERLFLVAQDISAQKKAQRALRESEQRARSAEQQLRDAIESISDGFVLYDSNTRLVICNKKFKEIYQYSDTDAAPGVTWNSLGQLDIDRGIVQSENESYYLNRRDHSDKGPPKTYPVRLTDGRSIQVRDRKTLEGGVVSIQSDVTANENLLEELRQTRDELENRILARTTDLELEVVERKTAEIKLRDALGAVQSADRAKTDFLATVSHELRTPLNAIIGFTAVMRDGNFGKIDIPKYQEYLGDIQASGEHLLALINDILDVSAVEAGKLELSEEECSLSTIIEDSVRLVATRVKSGNISLSVPDLAHGNYSIRVDERRIRQVLVNILNNAVKFTAPGGSIQIGTAMEPESHLSISVTDSGIGMTDDDIKRAMQPFVQIGNPMSREHEGTGLGLPLAKALVELHGGEFIVESVLGEGTTVTVRLPASRFA